MLVSDQLEDQHKGHDCHRRCRGVHDGGDEQRGYIRRVGDQEHGDPGIQKEPGRDKTFGRKFDPDDLAYRHCDHRLHGAEKTLIDQVGEYIGRNMHAGAVLTLDDRALPADRLDGIEESVPYTNAGQSEGALELSLHCDVHVFADDQCDHGRDQSGHGKNFPVVLEDEHAEIFAEVNGDLRDAPAVAACHEREAGPDLFFLAGRINLLILCIDHLETTCLSAYLRTNSSERPSPPSSFWLITRRIPSMVFWPKNSLASSILP